MKSTFGHSSTGTIHMDKKRFLKHGQVRVLSVLTFWQKNLNWWGCPVHDDIHFPCCLQIYLFCYALNLTKAWIKSIKKSVKKMVSDIPFGSCNHMTSLKFVIVLSLPPTFPPCSKCSLLCCGYIFYLPFFPYSWFQWCFPRWHACRAWCS